jgi:carboxypeptidase Taq
VSYARFAAEIAPVTDVLCAINQLDWDANVMMPAAGTQTRGQQIATLIGLARSMLMTESLAHEIDSALKELASAPPSDRRRRAVEMTKAAIETLARVPERLLTEIAELRTNATRAWGEARARNDFQAYAPFLERTFALQRELADAIGYTEHPYDALVGRYEPGMTLSRLRRLFDSLKAGLRPLIAHAAGLDPPRRDFLDRPFAVAKQRDFARSIAARMGFDFARGRLDDTLHPFEIALTRNDVRLTGRFKETFLPTGLFAVWHEAGHGMYEQGLDPELTRSALSVDLLNLEANGGASFGMHESQSRLWENRVGRSRKFWDLHFGELKSAFPAELADVSVEEFWRAVNVVEPGLIRVEADELTYDFHIMLRTEIEAALLTGDIAIADLPAVWAERMRHDLGVEVPDNARGVMQDIHWAGSMVGGFPSYTIGNVVASQLMAVAVKDPEIAAGLSRGDYAPLRMWLNDTVHRHGKGKTSDEILVEATGTTIDPAPYLAHLATRFQ